jgi:hypothetical protein
MMGGAIISTRQTAVDMLSTALANYRDTYAKFVISDIELINLSTEVKKLLAAASNLYTACNKTVWHDSIIYLPPINLCVDCVYAGVILKGCLSGDEQHWNLDNGLVVNCGSILQWRYRE